MKKTSLLMLKAISSASNRRKNFHLSGVLFELPDFKKIKPKNKVLENQYLKHYIF